MTRCWLLELKKESTIPHDSLHKIGKLLVSAMAVSDTFTLADSSSLGLQTQSTGSIESHSKECSSMCYFEIFRH